MDYRELAHRFFYDRKGHGQCAGVNVSFVGERFYSYATVIGIIHECSNKDGKPVLLYSMDNMGKTTARHISTLRRACPFDMDHQISVPFCYGHYMDIDDLQLEFLRRLNNFHPSMMDQKVHRSNFLELYSGLQRFSEHVKGIPCRVFVDYADIYNIAALQASQKERMALISGVKAKQEAAEKAKQASRKRKLKAVLKKPYLDIIKAAFADSSLDAEMRGELQKYLNPGNGDYLSYLWVSDNGNIRTSQGVNIEANIVTLALRAWKADKIHAGYHIGPYVLRAMKDEFVTIGCHNIPWDNINALHEELVVKQDKQYHDEAC